jgi:hypothetical protein
MKQTTPYHDPILDWHVAQCIKGDELKVADKIQARGGETAVPMGKGRDNWKRGKKSEGKEFAILEGYVPYRGVYPQKADGVIYVLDGLISDKVMQIIMARYLAGEFNEAKKAIDAALKMAGKMVNVDHRTLGKLKAKIVRVLPDNRFEISFEARSGYVKGEVGLNEIIL